MAEWLHNADGSVGIYKNDKSYQTQVKFCQSNASILAAISAAFGNTGSHYKHQPNGPGSGKYSDGEVRQSMAFVGPHALVLAKAMLPFAVMKTAQFRLIIEYHADGARPRSILHSESKKANQTHPVPRISLDCENITGPYFAGLTDGDGCVYVHKAHISADGHSQIWSFRLNVTQEKSPDLLEELQTIYGGVLSVVNKGGLVGRLTFSNKEAIVAVCTPLRQYMVVKAVKLDTLLEHMFQVNLQ